MDRNLASLPVAPGSNLGISKIILEFRDVIELMDGTAKSSGQLIRLMEPISTV